MKIEMKVKVSSEIFANRKLSILEALIHNLREKGVTNARIAGLLNKDQRNTWTIYSMAVRKLKKQ